MGREYSEYLFMSYLLKFREHRTAEAFEKRHNLACHLSKRSLIHLHLRIGLSYSVGRQVISSLHRVASVSEVLVCFELNAAKYLTLPEWVACFLAGERQ